MQSTNEQKKHVWMSSLDDDVDRFHEKKPTKNSMHKFFYA